MYACMYGWHFLLLLDMNYLHFFNEVQMVDLCELLITTNSTLYLIVEVIDANFFYHFHRNIHPGQICWCQCALFQPLLYSILNYMPIIYLNEQIVYDMLVIVS